ncbi:MAG: flagellar protein FlaG [Selenomonadaceae bacterium]|nr:flagellar protein FlaG [Selenomonadaceae bacterium]
MVGKLKDIVTAAVVLDATNKTKPSSSDSQQKIQAAAKTDSSAQIRPAETQPVTKSVKQPSLKSSAKGEQIERKIQTPQEQAADNLKRKQEIEEQEKQSKLVPGTLTEEAVSNMTNALNKLMRKTNVNLEFDYKKEVNLMSVKMLEKGTNKVIKEFPPEEMIENMIKARDWLGAFIDKTV